VLTLVSFVFSFINTSSAGLLKQSMGTRKRGGEIEKILPEDRAVPTLFKQIQWKKFLDLGIRFVSISSVKVYFLTCMILTKKTVVTSLNFLQH
jgi:hypothetical protein